MVSLIIGVIGFAFLLIGYILSLFGVIDQESLYFNLLNFIGAVLLVYYVNGYGYMSITILPGIWALVALCYIFLHKKAKKSPGV